jgi:carboxypeptidase C (cathepsin A)
MAENENSQQENQKNDHPLPQDNLIETQHSITINGETIEYTVTTGTIILKEETPDREKESEGHKPKVEFFFIAYTRNDVTDPASRPVSFSFNGGPGSSSVWLHLGLLGPRRVFNLEDGHQPQPPFKLVDNEFSLLDKTDLVFIDPVSTGYTRVVPGEKPKKYHGYKKDIELVGEFIRLYTSRYKRWLSPKFLIGESYGTTRAAALSDYLQDVYGMYLNGIMLVSSILNFQTARFIYGNELPFVLFLPSYTAAAWYHNKLDADLQADLRKTLNEAEKFAVEEYLVALFRGSDLTGEDRAGIVKKLARYTGLSEKYIEQTELRINTHRFFKELLRDEGYTIGRLDSRLKGIDRDRVGEYHEYDPLLTEIMGTYTAAFNHYVRAELAYESDLPYEILNGKVWPWSYQEFENTYLEVSEKLRKAMTINPYLKVFVGNGYYDLGTPYFATEYTFNHMQLHPELQENVHMEYYEAGHMMYMHMPSLAKMKADLAAFLDSAVPE